MAWSRGRPRAVRRLRLAHRSGSRTATTSRRSTAAIEAAQRRRPAVAHRRADAHRLRQPATSRTRQKAHGAPLGDDEVRLTKEAYGWDPGRARSTCPTRSREACCARPSTAARRWSREWERALDRLRDAYPDEAAELRRRLRAAGCARRLGRGPQDLRGRRGARDAQRQPGRDPGARRRPCRSCSAARRTSPNRT